MKLHDYLNQQHEMAYSQGWNAAVDVHGVDIPMLVKPDCPLSGSQQESWLEGYEAAQDFLITERIKNS